MIDSANLVHSFVLLYGVREEVPVLTIEDIGVPIPRNNVQTHHCELVQTSSLLLVLEQPTLHRVILRICCVDDTHGMLQLIPGWAAPRHVVPIKIWPKRRSATTGAPYAETDRLAVIAAEQIVGVIACQLVGTADGVSAKLRCIFSLGKFGIAHEISCSDTVQYFFDLKIA